MTDLNMHQRMTLWALRIGCKGPARIGQIIKAHEPSYQSEGYRAVVEKAVAELVDMGLVQRMIVPGTTQRGPGYTLYGLTLRGYDFREDEEHGTA